MDLENAAKFITKSFLETETGCEVVKFSIEEGTKSGDNYMSVLYSICAEIVPYAASSATTTQHYLLKCYPSHPSRQKFLNNSNLFNKELSFYMKWAKELMLFQKAFKIPDAQIIQLAIPACISGKAINFEECKPEDKEKVHCPLSNYIMMVDLRKELGFQMTDRTKGLDKEHVKLAFEELAKMHALSWAYRTKVEWHLESKFPFFKKSIDPNKTEMWLGILKENIDTAITAIDNVMGSGNVLSKSIGDFSHHAKSVIESFVAQTETSEKSLLGLHRDPSKILQYGGGNEDESEPWRVVCHGDMWNNNLLFRYDEKTKKPVKVVLVDFPLARLGCPTLDLSCLVYTSTRKSFREKHLEGCLQSYHDKFNEVCEQLDVKSLPGFCLASLKRKYHVMKLVGLLIAAISLPLNLIDSGKEVNLEQKSHTTEMKDMIREACASGEESSLYQTWIVELVQELYDEGVI